ncbi:cytoplasmic dynein 2 intermediate chain 2-like isoform X2 [Ptychodera flava]|uniref:cytoplasmic dynein 2 intermediate chain 2-like isoform X2 n=1 Tax=Ptychodera flava TaxID=63121 RepID=UPI003969D365
MFADEELDSVEFKSTWKKERSLKSSSAQTSEILTDEVEVQSIHRVNVRIQTEEEPEKSFHIGHDESKELQEFLQRVEPFVSKQLDKNIRSHAFDGYEVNWREDAHAVTCIHTLSHAALDGELQCTGLSWNSTGSVVAVAFGRFDHQDWCTHKSMLCTWNVDRTLNAHKPVAAIDLSSCLMCIAFHPKKPAIIAGGNFNGEIVIWDLSREDETIVATSGIGDDSHREPVSKLRWIEDPSSKGKKYNIVSVSSDGKILIWQVNRRKGSLELAEGFVLLTESMPRDLKRKARLGGNTEMGVTCISYAHEDKSLFVVGSESGGVFKCSMNARGSAAGANIQSSVPLRSPVTFSFQPHHGPVYAVDCSPYHRNLLLSCGTDTTARIYSMLQDKPVLSIEPGLGYLFAAKWSPVRPLVFAVVTGEGLLLIYDLKTSKINPVYTLQAGTDKEPVFTLEFNQNQRQLLATGDGAGVVRVWQLSDELTTQGAREIESLADIAASALD